MVFCRGWGSTLFHWSERNHVRQTDRRKIETWQSPASGNLLPDSNPTSLNRSHSSGSNIPLVPMGLNTINLCIHGFHSDARAKWHSYSIPHGYPFPNKGSTSEICVDRSSKVAGEIKLLHIAFSNLTPSILAHEQETSK